MVIGSNKATYFDQESSNGWPPLGNSGDSVFLNDRDANEVHSIAYGNSVATPAGTPNAGITSISSSAATLVFPTRSNTPAVDLTTSYD